MTVLLETALIRLSGRARILSLWLGVGLLAGFCLAASLVPDPSGQGTHRQLGFPPCTFLSIFGRPCPMCGMTTCFAYFVRGQWYQAARVQPAGLLLAVEMLLLLGISLRATVQGVLTVPVRIERSLTILMLANFLMVLLVWLTRLLCC